MIATIVLVIVLAIVLGAPAAIFAVECLLGAFPLRRPPLAEPPAPSFAVLVPAHDEASGIEPTVAAIKAALRPGDRLLVVADNCTDDTAARARSAGAEVGERQDSALSGKGHALAFGREILSADPPAMVIVMDADCWTAPEALRSLAAEAGRTGGTVQARYQFETPASPDPRVQISNFALLVKNVVRQRGLARLGAPAVLQGTGMAFPWSAFQAAKLATGAIAEDLEIGIQLLVSGHRVGWTEQAIVWSKPASREATLTQRTRWEHGFLSTALATVPGLVGAAIRRGRPGLLVLAGDLLVPPLAMLVALVLLAMAGSALLLLFGGSAAPLIVSGAALSAIALGTIVAWIAEGRRTLPVGALVKVPLYVLWKLPIYARLLGRRQRQWVRTSRED